MEISFAGLKEKEIVNLLDGKKLGRLIDIVFDNSSGTVKGIVVPGERKLFRKNEDIFIPIEKLKKIGDDVILVNLQVASVPDYRNVDQPVYAQNQMMVYPQTRATYNQSMPQKKYQSQQTAGSYVRYKRIDNKKYK